MSLESAAEGAGGHKQKGPECGHRRRPGLLYGRRQGSDRKESQRTRQDHATRPGGCSDLVKWASQVALVVKNLPAYAGDRRDVGSITGT